MSPMTDSNFIDTDDGMLDGGHGYDIAIIGMAGRFPGADDIQVFWQHLTGGVESIRTFSREEMEAAGVDPHLLDHPHYVNTGGHLDGADLFDSGFFGFYPREADILDPQQRIFLEVAWEAIEHAGYNPSAYKGVIGVYGGMSLGSYIFFNLMRNRVIRETVQPYQLPLNSDKDFLTTRVSYKLNLNGPSVDVQSACSSSLVATHLACQSLLNYECDIALAGGVSVRIPQKSGYLYQEGGILSPDGHCRPFSADAKGTVSGDGAGIVVLKRLEDALRDGDAIYAIIKGTAINNDGAGKVGYTAPSVDGQVRVIASAQALAGVDPASISYIEAHGTGTVLGDPIEIEALTQVFREHTDEKQFCAIGSVKANIGHLDAAAGVAGLIKTVLALHHRQLPPSINYIAPNPRIDFVNSPFYVQQTFTDWNTDRLPRRAGVSSFGMGGTNAHAVLEESPNRPPSGASRAWQLLVLSARTANALEQASDRFASYLHKHPDVSLADAAYTLKVGRKTFKHRRIWVARDVDEAVSVLEQRDGQYLLDAEEEFEDRPVAFMFSGQGAQYANMARGLYENEPIFAKQVDHCAALLTSHVGLDIRTLLFPASGEEQAAADKLKETQYTQPALFTIEYALAQLWMRWGIQPSAMIGHSIGEYVAATLAGVFDLDSALELVAARGRMMQSMPPGAMLSVQMSETDIAPWLAEDDRLSLAAINAPGLIVVSGPFDAIDALERRLDEAGHGIRRLHTSHAFHSSMMAPILQPFTALVARMQPQSPQIRFLSNVTGSWITPEQATDPAYWAQHLRQGVRFADGVGLLLQESSMALLEVGPGNTLTRLARWHDLADKDRIILASLRHPRVQRDDQAFLLETLGQLWMKGVDVDWRAFYEGEVRYRIPLPTYPFQRQRHWIDPDAAEMVFSSDGEKTVSKRENINEWLYVPAWRRSPVTGHLSESTGGHAPWLIFKDKLGDPMVGILSEAGYPVITVQPGSTFSQTGETHFALRPGNESDLQMLFEKLDAEGRLPERLIIAWNDKYDLFEKARQRGIDTFMHMMQALQKLNIMQSLDIVFIGHHALDFSGLSELSPFQAMAIGPCRVASEEFSNIRCRFFDISVPEDKDEQTILARKVARDIILGNDKVVAYRGGRRWVQSFESLQPPDHGDIRLRSRGVYLITGGLGHMGLLFARYLAEKVGTRLALLGRTPLPLRKDWPQMIAEGMPDDPIIRKIRGVLELESLGAEVMYFSADVADESAMHQVVRDTIEHFGALHGVFHAAGIVGLDALAPMAELTPGQCDQHYQAKVLGTMTLARVLADRHLDFVFLQSSLSTVLGGFGMAAYAAANAFMDSFAAQQSRQGDTLWMSIDWDGWAFEVGGMAQVSLGGASEFAIRPGEGLAVLDHILAYEDLSQIVISTADLNARLRVLATHHQEDEASVEDDSAALAGVHPRPELSVPFVAPENSLEKAIATLWEQTLGVGPIGREDDFFELGGHSLLATQIVSRLRDDYHVSLPLRDLFESPTVAGLAHLIARDMDESGVHPQPTAIGPVPRKERMPLSSGQQRLWFLERLQPGALYNNFAAIRVHGPLDLTLLTKSLEGIVQRHEILRTTFHEESGMPYQRIHPAMPVKVSIQDLGALDEKEKEAQVHDLAIASARQPFDLSEGPLMRVQVLRLGPEEHVIFFTMHHIVSDGWSVTVLIQELVAHYRALQQGRQPDLSPLAIQYADYAVWQREQLHSEEIGQQVAWWREQLSDIEPLALPADRPRPPIQTTHGANEWFQIPSSLYEKLVAVSKQEGVTSFMIMTAAIAALLHRYTMQDDIALGTPIANRTRVETEGLIGFLLNTLVLRIDLSDNPTFAELLNRVRETTLGAYDQQDVPFEMLVDELQPERDMSRTPLFQVMIDLQHSHLSRLDLPGLTLSPLRIDDGTAKFDMAFSLEEDESSLSGYLNYNTDLFRDDTIKRLLQHLLRLLDAALSAPEQRLSQLPLLTDDELALLDVWGGLTREGIARVPDILQQFSSSVAAAPDAIAIQQGDVRLTYAALDARANQLAHGLIARGVGPEQVVGILLGRTPDMIVAMLGVLKAGAAFVILAPDYPDERIQFILQDAGVRVVISDKPDVRGLGVAGGDHPEILNLSTLSVEHASPDLLNVVHPSNAAYIVYTSGSTGQPKGVIVEHGPLARHIASIRQVFGIVPADKVLQFAALTFDQGLEQVLVTLTTGATLVMRGEDIWPPSSFADVIQATGLTVINLPPAYLAQVMNDWHEHPEQVAETTLRLIISGGDALTPEVVAQWQDIAPDVQLLNAYGPTETIITSATYAVPADIDTHELSGALPIGSPISPRTAVILDGYGNRTPIGVAGELFIGGSAIARGYLHRTDATAAAFTPDAFLDQKGARGYRTGDLARFRADGVIEFLGRIDYQVKVRGFRIELGEIEAALHKHPAIDIAIAHVYQPQNGSKELVAYLHSKNGPLPPAGDIQDYLRQHLPHYMIPTILIPLEDVPFTRSGKVNRRALPAVDGRRLGSGRSYTPPTSPVEEDLAAIWQGVLGVERIGIHDNFFELGGHSLLATQIASRIREHYDVEIPLRALFESPTIAKLAELITEAMLENVGDEELSDLLDQLDDLSEEALMRLLEEDA